MRERYTWEEQRKRRKRKRITDRASGAPSSLHSEASTVCRRCDWETDSQMSDGAIESETKREKDSDRGRQRDGGETQTLQTET